MSVTFLSGVEDYLNHVGIRDLLTILVGGDRTTRWELGFVDVDGFTGYSVNDTLSSHPGWEEIFANVAETRYRLDPDGPIIVAANYLSAECPMKAGDTFVVQIIPEFDFTARGFLLVYRDDASAWSLWTTVDFASPVNFKEGEEYAIRYVFNLDYPGGGP